MSKYKCDDKIKIYSDVPMTNKQYRRMIQSAKPRYMNDYYNTPRYNPRKDEKSFNNLLNSYYYDYSKLRNKYNFTDYEENYEDDEEQNNGLDFNEYQEKKKDLFDLFLSNDMSDITETTFDLTDNLIKNLYNGKNDTFLKNTQTKKDYDFRLNDNRTETKFKSAKNVDYDEKENEKKEEEKDENEENEGKEEKEDNEENDGKEENDEREEDNIIASETGNDNELINSADKEEVEQDEVDKKKDDNDENYLKLKNNNKSQENLLFQDIIKYDDNNKGYQPPLYLVPNSVKKEKEKEKEEQKQKEHLYDEQKQSNINKNDKGEMKVLKDIIVDSKYPLFTQIINPNYKIDYIPQPCFPHPSEEQNSDENNKENKGQNDDNKNNKINNKDDNYDDFEEYKFDDNEINDGNKEKKEDDKSPLLEEIIDPKNVGGEKQEGIQGNNNIEDEDGAFYSITNVKEKNKQNNIEGNENNKNPVREFRTPDFDNNDVQKNEENKNETGENNDINKQPVVDQMIKQDFDEDKKKVNKLKESINNNDENDKFESIGVDDLNADDNDDDYGGFD